ncbi:MAG: NAD(P)H-hydrate dehydratase [Acidobacteria bacterium]|nr:NAD(P)H-hydrate dehydratase [Acidobacteriota bacterium]
MIKILKASEVNEIDHVTCEKIGIPRLILMENAGIQVVSVLQEVYPDLPTKKIGIFCGKGNNGGDAMVVSRQLTMKGIAPEVYLLAARDQYQGDALTNLKILEKIEEIQLREVTTTEEWRRAAQQLDQYDIKIDGLLGTGITKPVEGLYAEVIQGLNESRGENVSIDIPSGLFCDSESREHPSVVADVTVTFTAPKVSHLLGDAAEAVGKLFIRPIGSPDSLLQDERYFLNLITPEDVRGTIPPRRPTSHKGDYGRILVVAGSRGKTGAAAMVGFGALRSGAGLVTIATPRGSQPVVASQFYELMTEGLEETGEGTISEAALDRVLRLLEDSDVLALGPGLSTHPSTVTFVRQLVKFSPVPLVLDADGLNGFRGERQLLQNHKGLPLVITPHPGEMGRLMNLSTSEVLKNRVSLSRTLAREQGIYVILKGHRTLVADPGGQVYVCPTGNPGMATAGVGDVLTGVVASFLVKRQPEGHPKEYAAALSAAVYAHGLAGDLAAARRGEESLVAGDLLDSLADAFQQVLGNPARSRN